MVCLNVNKGVQKAAIPAAAEKPVSKLKSYESTFSKSFIICFSFQISLIIDQGSNTCCNLATRYRQNLCQYIFLGSDCDEAQICTYIVFSHRFTVQVLCKASYVDSSQWSWQNWTKWSACGFFCYTPRSLGSQTKLELWSWLYQHSNLFILRFIHLHCQFSRHYIFAVTWSM